MITFLPYQQVWLKDQSRFKIWEKSRRIGATFTQAYEDVIDASKIHNPMDVWFSSADQTAAIEYIRLCAQWARILQIASSAMGNSIIDTQHNIHTSMIEFNTGKRIYGLSSNPCSFRSKGGKLVLDEFAFHQDAEGLWQAAAPIVTWGYPVRIISTYNGIDNLYWRIVKSAHAGQNTWNVHTTSIEDAVSAGLADCIAQRPLDEHERRNFIEECRNLAGDDQIFNQEYMCLPIEQSQAWLSWSLVLQCEDSDAGEPAYYQKGPAFIGMDIGRRGHETVIWIIEPHQDVLWTREVIRLQGASFAEQDKALDRVFTNYQIVRCCMDQTGLGEKPVEDAKQRYGDHRVEGILFTAAMKSKLALLGRRLFENRTVRIPPDPVIRESHHGIRRMVSPGGTVRFEAKVQQGHHHGDAFWAHMLSLYATQQEDPGYDYDPVHSSATRRWHNVLGSW